MVEKFDVKSAKKGNFNKQMGFRKKSNKQKKTEAQFTAFSATLQEDWHPSHSELGSAICKKGSLDLLAAHRLLSSEQEKICRG